MAAKGMRHRRDNADLPNSIIKGIAARRLAQAIGQLTHGTKSVQCLQNLVHGDHHFRRPHAIFFQRHELDETHDHAFFAGETGELHNLIFIEAAQQHAVDLYRLKPSALCGTNSGKNVFKTIGHAGNAGKPDRLDRVHAHGGAPQPGGLQGRCQIGEQVAVGGDGQIELCAVCGTKLCQFAYEIHQAVAQQRLAAGKPYFLNAKMDENLYQPQVIGKRQVRVERAFVSRAAVDTLVIAAVGDADAEVSDKASVFVAQAHLVERFETVLST